jgi:hypothetical protein
MMICPTCEVYCSYVCPCCLETVTSAWHLTEDVKRFENTEVCKNYDKEIMLNKNDNIMVFPWWINLFYKVRNGLIGRKV